MLFSTGAVFWYKLFERRVILEQKLKGFVSGVRLQIFVGGGEGVGGADHNPQPTPVSTAFYFCPSFSGKANINLTAVSSSDRDLAVGTVHDAV